MDSKYVSASTLPPGYKVSAAVRIDHYGTTRATTSVFSTADGMPSPAAAASSTSVTLAAPPLKLPVSASSSSSSSSPSWQKNRFHKLLHNFYEPFLRSSHPAPLLTDKCWTRAVYAFTCPPHGRVGFALNVFLFFIFGWLILYGISRESALPGGAIFDLCVIAVGSMVFGWVARRVLGLSGGLGGLLWGLLIRNVLFPRESSFFLMQSLHVHVEHDALWLLKIIRCLTLTIMLLRISNLLFATDILNLFSREKTIQQREGSSPRWWLLVFALVFMSSVVSVAGVTIIAHFVLRLPFAWSLLLSWMAPTLPPMSMRFAVDRENHEERVENSRRAVTFAAILTSLIAVCGYGFTHEFILSRVPLVWKILRIPLEIVVGIVFGALVGSLLKCLPVSRQKSTDALQLVMFFFAISSIVLCAYIPNLIGFGLVTCITTSLVYCRQHIRHDLKENHEERRSVCGKCNKGNESKFFKNCDFLYNHAMLCTFWAYVLEPIIFGLLGSEISVKMFSLAFILKAAAIILLLVIVECAVNFVLISKFIRELELWRRVSLSMSYISKSTIPALFGAFTAKTLLLTTSHDRNLLLKTNLTTPAQLSNSSNLFKAKFQQNLLLEAKAEEEKLHHAQCELIAAVVCVLITMPLADVVLHLVRRHRMKLLNKTTSSPTSTTTATRTTSTTVHEENNYSIKATANTECVVT